jgi:hypothetical protein
VATEMVCAVGPWVWKSATAEDPMAGWYPPDGAANIVDMRPAHDCELANQYDQYPHSLFLFSPGATIPIDYYQLGSGRIDECKIGETERNEWGRFFTVDGVGDTIADLLWNHLTINASGDGTRPTNPIVAGYLGFRELHVPGHSCVRRDKCPDYDPSNAYWQVLIQQLRRDFQRLCDDTDRERNELGKTISDLAKDQSGGQKEKAERAAKAAVLSEIRAAKAEVPEKNLGALKLKYPRLDLAAVSRDVKAKKPTTTRTESWPSDGAVTSGQDNSWSSLAASGGVAASVSSGRLSCNHSAYFALPRCDNDLSSADHVCTTTVYTFPSGTQFPSVNTRYSSSAVTCYHWDLRPGSPGTSYMGRWSAASFTTIATSSITPADGNTLGLRSDGTSHTRIRNGSDIASSTDVNISSNLRCGTGVLGTSVRTDSVVMADLIAWPHKIHGIVPGAVHGIANANLAKVLGV